mmetsp:Transcript_30563/g.90751  ORF Transcript_30563/g.90751 Transcript_30563/m.90751 type:complete len:131 (-) Transcript_30563:99-491(-)
MAAVQQACLPVALAVPPPLDRSTGLSANFGQVALGAPPPPFGSAAAAAVALEAATHGAGRLVRPPAVLPPPLLPDGDPFGEFHGYLAAAGGGGGVPGAPLYEPCSAAVHSPTSADFLRVTESDFLADVLL